MGVENLDSGYIQMQDGATATTTGALGTGENAGLAYLGAPTRLAVGEGGPGFLKSVDDYIANTASGIATLGSTYRLCRFPTNAKVKGVLVDLSSLEAATAGTAALALSINVAFSDSTFDGTTVANQGQLPSSSLNGTTVASATGASANKLFGSITATGTVGLLSSGTVHNTEVMWNGSLTGWFPAGRDEPLYDFFGFVDTQGDAVDPGGNFDLLFAVTAAAGVGAIGYIAAKVSYIQ